MKKILIALVLLAIPTGAALADHSWATYHWPDDKLSPSVKDRTKDSLYDVPAGVEEWADLETPIQPGMAGKKGEITVKEASNIFWLGLARIFIEGDHITKGEVQLNTRLLADYGSAAADHVLCQELGHILGLDHQRDSDPLSCMDDTAPLGSVTSPNGHDQFQLNAIYTLHDGAPTGDDGGGGGPPCSKNPNHPNCQPSGRWVTVDVFPVPEDD